VTHSRVELDYMDAVTRNLPSVVRHLDRIASALEKFNKMAEGEVVPVIQDVPLPEDTMKRD
jgi:hypothetical protein